ncbi:MAG: flippase-like domain-containing protein [Methanocellales archaeon]
MQFRKRRHIIFAIIIGGIIFSIFTFEIGWGKFIQLLYQSEKRFLLLAVGFNFLNVLAFTLSWKVIVFEKINLRRLMRLYLVGVFVNYITPSMGTAGEPVKAYLLSRDTKSEYAKAFATVMTQRLLNMLPFTIVTILGIGTLIAFRHSAGWEFWVLGISFSITIAMFLFLIYLYTRKERLKTIARVFLKLFFPLIRRYQRGGVDYEKYLHKIDHSVDSFHSGLKEISNHKIRLASSIFFSFLGWFFDVLLAYTIFLALNYNIDIGILIVAYSVAMVAGMLPLFLPGGLGTVDATMALLYVAAGVPVEIALLSTVLYRLIQYWLTTIIGATCTIGI